MHRFLEILHGLVLRVQTFAEEHGGPGLAIVAFFDSSFLTLPEVADLLVVIFTIRSPDDWYYFAAMTTLGSVSGCYALYLVGRKGGQALLRKRFRDRHIDRGLAWFRRYGAFVLIVPAILPPPMPFKVFVLLAGVSGLGRSPFLVAVAIGRGLRYGGEALLARWYGERAAAFLQQNMVEVFLQVLGGLAVLGVMFWIWRRFLGPNTPASPAEPPAPGPAPPDVE